MKERLERFLAKKDFEATRYDQIREIAYVREVERGPTNERQFLVAIPLENTFALFSWDTDRVIVSTKSTQKTWGLVTRVVERRMADQ